MLLLHPACAVKSGSQCQSRRQEVDGVTGGGGWDHWLILSHDSSSPRLQWFDSNCCVSSSSDREKLEKSGAHLSKREKKKDSVFEGSLHQPKPAGQRKSVRTSSLLLY